MDTKESNFRFFKKKELPYIQTYIKMKRKESFKKKQLFSRTIVSKKNKPITQFKTKLTI